MKTVFQAEKLHHRGNGGRKEKSFLRELCGLSGVAFA
jgi:hypothetical protein